MFPKSRKTRQPAGPRRRGVPGLRMGFPPTGLSSPPCTGAPDPSTRSLPQCLILRPFTWGHPGQKVPPANTPTPSPDGHGEALKAIPRPPPIPRKKGPRVSHSQPTPWTPASFLPVALPTACGGSPGNMPRFHRPTGLKDEEGTHGLQRVPRFSGKLPKIWGSGRLQERKKRNSQMVHTQDGPENGLTTSSQP